ncbi:RidA family protein [Paenarthrobacter ureafaciens]|uniref:RidA family protein n=1 Tax=Paenarthrobacter ureafaciens TaxID=37931 RepID=UPI00191702AB|nr:RidA family protein [Paenarthrobacter ureafaciens]QQQ64395.1 RidA family protein [Paenarthrobacter ureafaciens]
MNTPKPSPPYSKTRETDSLVFTAGHIGRDSDGQMKEGLQSQTELALQNLEDSLLRHGLNRANVVRTTVYLADMAHWDEMNEPYRAFFEEPFPARSTVSVGLPGDVLIEIDAVAGKAIVQ